ncbi:MAG: hypothetical protein ACTSYD_12555 [Candidatus Heimdallarchaeaceae archaeon]
MMKLKTNHHPLYVIVFGLLHLLMIIGVLWLAAIANKALYWVFSSIITIILIYLGVVFFIQLYEPKIIYSHPENRFARINPNKVEEQNEQQ